jgi:hypothetical protein
VGRARRARRARLLLYSSRRGEVCGFYPSPAGVTECTLDLAAWARLAQAHPLLSSPDEDVEAVLVNRSEAGVECFLVPIDVCYELAGRMRMLWQGFDGGAGGAAEHRRVPRLGAGPRP